MKITQTNDVLKMSTDNRKDIAARLPRVRSGNPKKCSCGSNDLKAWHQFGAMIICASCGKSGPFIKGDNYQSEEEHACFAWNR